MDTVLTCCRCGSALPKRHRKYCINCSALASEIWKRAQRLRWRGTPYSLDPWLKKAGGDEHEARRLRSEYMREYRAKARGSDQSESGHSLRARDGIGTGVVNSNG
jgi:hypothetical protein